MPDPIPPQPDVAQGLGEPAQTHLVEDSHTGVRAVHLKPVRVGAAMYGPAVERGDVEAGQVGQETADIPLEPSVWEATGDEER
jgi:hypothetical protein